MLMVATLPFLMMLAGCQSQTDSGNSQGPIESQKPQSAIHGDMGVGVESRDTSGIAPRRPDYIVPTGPIY
jgi:hypothetical protein